MEKVIWIVFPLNFHQAIVIVPVGRFDPVDSFLHHEVYVGAAHAVGMECLPIVFRPSRDLFGIRRFWIDSGDHHRPLRVAITKRGLVTVDPARRAVYWLSVQITAQTGGRQTEVKVTFRLNVSAKPLPAEK